MSIDLPPETEVMARSAAQAAGFPDVSAYVLSLIDADAARQSREPAWRPSPDDPCVIAAIDAGYASGVSEQSLDELVDELRGKLASGELAGKR